MPESSLTWHYGLVARWWAEFNRDGPEIDYFQSAIETFGEPALDVGCGTGRVLLPLLRAGLDIDGADVSGDMLAHCRRLGEREGVSPRLHEQPMHELDIARSYRTIFVCGSFGIGGVRAFDVAALERFHQQLAPGGALLIDRPGASPSAERWHTWAERTRANLPEPWPAAGDRRRAADGTEYELWSRRLDVRPEDRVVALEIRVDHLRDGRREGREQRTLLQSVYSEDELLEMMRRAGFTDVRAEDGYVGSAARPQETVRVLIARKRPAASDAASASQISG